VISNQVNTNTNNINANTASIQNNINRLSTGCSSLTALGNVAQVTNFPNNAGGVATVQTDFNNVVTAFNAVVAAANAC